MYQLLGRLTAGSHLAEQKTVFSVIPQLGMATSLRIVDTLAAGTLYTHPCVKCSKIEATKTVMVIFLLQSNFNGSNTFWTIKISSRQG